MARTGQDYLKALKDRACRIFIGGELVSDVTTHPAFANATKTVAGLYDLAADPANASALTFVEDGKR